MQILILWYSLLLSFGHSLGCDPQSQYRWNVDGGLSRCCTMCKPGHFMTERCNSTFDTTCLQCQDNHYIEFNNQELCCKICSRCTKNHMVYKENCTFSKDAVCGCKSGYTFDGQECKPIVTMITASTTNTKTTQKEIPPRTRDNVWITLSLCCACVCILLTCFVLISRHTPACGWIMSTSSDCDWPLNQSSAKSSQCTDEHEVPLPVQEVCAKSEWQEDV